MKKIETKKKIFSLSTDNEILSLSSTEQDTAKTVKSAAVYCSLLKSICKNDVCETCSALHTTFNGYWKCSYCVTSLDKQLPFWGDTECITCGCTYGVLIYCIPLA